MKKHAGSILLSATDLMRFMGCSHATFLDLQRLQGKGPEPGESSEEAELLQRQGDAHEKRFLEHLKSTGKDIVEIPRGNLETDSEATRNALVAGKEVVFQGAFRSANWGGWSDFLIRVDRPSKLGNFSYEVTDTKLKRRPDPKHVLQLVLYSDLLADIQGSPPEFAHLQLGDGRHITLRLSDYAHYARSSRNRLEAFVAEPRETRPIPCADCAVCRWASHCESVWQSEDSLFNVANITRAQVKKLEAAGIKTMASLSALEGKVAGMSEATRQRLVAQASLQHNHKSGSPEFRLRTAEPGKGFSLLPSADPGDIFYDIEGDPHYDGGLEYLHGIWDGENFEAIWGHDHAKEKEALEAVLSMFRSQVEKHPKAHVYHYAAYEISALRRLTTKYGTGEALLDRMQREGRFVDLFSVVRGGLIASVPNYSIKSMEVFYDLRREGEVTTAGGSVVAYERWRETGDQGILDEIESYNRLDCISTQKLRDWLLSIRPQNIEWPQPGTDQSQKENDEDADATRLRAELAKSELPTDRQDMLFNLGLFHKREAKPTQWAVFASAAKEEDELIDDLDTLAALESIGEVKQEKRSFVRTYSFPPQETRLTSGKTASVAVADGPPVSVNITELDEAARKVTIKVGPKKKNLLGERITLHPDWPLGTEIISAALRDVIADQCGPRRYRAVDDLLSRVVPRLKGVALQLSADVVADATRIVQAMDDTVLAIQGPPGTGKTYVTARAIVALVKEGARVGVTSNSHEAIRNVLLACEDALAQGGLALTPKLIHKVSDDEAGYPARSSVLWTNDNATAAHKDNDVVGATAWFFSRPENIAAFDWLLVDEAGQVSLANLVAMGRAARNIVLVGDPQQLPQVIQGAHPEPASLSCLQWMLGEHATIPSDRGIFLPETRRMHPAICSFVSAQVYEGRLASHPHNEQQAVRGTKFPASGAFWVSTLHQGNAQISREEIAAIKMAANELLKGEWTDRSGATRKVRKSDIIVVAPYNAQVNALRAELPPQIRVGTVDKFQGQEAPICLVSMTASSAEESPRGMDFLFSLNRMNVAVSRAKALVLIFGSDRLKEAKCDTVERMRLVNAICALPKLP